MNEQWFKLSIQQIEEKLKTSAALGLSQKAARSRVNKNVGSVFLAPHASPWRILGELISDFSWILLVFSAIISLFFEDYRSGTVVVIMLLANLAISFLTYYDVFNTVEQISSHFSPKLRIIRGGRLFYMNVRRVVPGDVMLIEEGDILCCDARLVHSDNLTVSMRLDQKSYVSLKKYAEGFVASRANHPREMENMVHAGSIVQEGSARAIVTDVGRHTYLGALTGGIRLPDYNITPDGLQTLRKKCAKWNTVLLLSILPLCILSLLIGYFFGGTLLLSTAFLTYLSVVATGVSHLVITTATHFYSAQCRRLLRGSHASAIRTPKNLEQLANIDYLFVRDGAALSDGIIHFSSALDCDGEIQKESPRSTRILKDIVGLYYATTTGSLSTGLRHASIYEDGLREFIKTYSVDLEALRIRYKTLSYLSGNLNTEDEKICIEERGQRLWVSVSTDPEAIRRCTGAVRSDRACPIGDEMRGKLIEQCKHMRSVGFIPLIFKRISDDGIDKGNSCLIGVLFFKEGIDQKGTEHLCRLEELGCRVIFFSDPKEEMRIPTLVSPDQCLSKNALLVNKLPATYHFGRYRMYIGLETGDIEEILAFLHSNNKRVALLGFHEQERELKQYSELFISCAPIHGDLRGSPEEIVGHEVSGRAHSTSCTQVVKEQASMLIPRPKRQGGGLSSIVHAIYLARKVNGALHDFFAYMVAAQIVRILLAVVPMLFGKSVLDARHVIFCSCIMDCFAFFMFTQTVQEKRSAHRRSKYSRNADEYMRLLIYSAGAAVLALILPFLLELIGKFGPFLYQTEYLFLAMVALHLTVLILILYPSSRQFKAIRSNYLLGIELVFLVLFGFLCLVSREIGVFFALERYPIAYTVTALVPSIALAVVVGVQRSKAQKPKTE